MTSLVDIYRRFPTRETAVAHLEAVRWPHGPECALCGATTTARHAENGSVDRWQCWTCGRSFSVTVGTIFQRSHVDLQRWFFLLELMAQSKQISSVQAARELDLRRPTVGRMMRRIRAAPPSEAKWLARLTTGP